MFLSYAEAKGAYDRAAESGGKDDLKAWKKSEMMRRVKRNFYDLHHIERVHVEPVEGCKVCTRLVDEGAKWRSRSENSKPSSS